MRQYLNALINKRTKQIEALKQLPTYPENYPVTGELNAEFETNLTRIYGYEVNIGEYKHLLKLLDETK